MAASTAFIGKGTTISWAGTTIAEVIGSPSGPSESADSVERTHMESTGRFREYMAGLVDGGEVTFDIAFLLTTASQTAVRAALEAGTTAEVIITFSDTSTSTCTFDAFCTGFQPTMPIDERVTATITLKLAAGTTWS